MAIKYSVHKDSTITGLKTIPHMGFMTARIMVWFLLWKNKNCVYKILP